MDRPSQASLTELTGEAILAVAFERLRPRLLAMIDRRVSRKLSLRLDPEGVVHDAFLRAWPRWRAADPKPADLDAWIYRQVLDRLIEAMRASLGPKRDLARELCEPEAAAGARVGAVAERLVDSQTGPTSAFSRAERCAAVRAGLEKLHPVDREILALRYFDGLSYAQIGVILDLSQNAANRRGLKAMVKLRQLIPAAFRHREGSEP